MILSAAAAIWLGSSLQPARICGPGSNLHQFSHITAFVIDVQNTADRHVAAGPGNEYKQACLCLACAFEYTSTPKGSTVIVVIEARLMCWL